LFHSLVNSRLILDVHLIELINATDSIIGQHQSTSFNTKLSSLCIFSNRSSQTSSTGRFTTRVNCPGKELANVLEELGLRCGGVSNNTNVDVSSEFNAIGSTLADSSKQLKQETFLYV
jgi:hypothetical protein